MKLRLGGMDHLLLAGLELGRQDSDNLRLTGYFGTATSLSVDSSNPRGSVSRWAGATSDANNEVRADLAALYVQDQITLTPRWKAVLGLRYDRYSVALDDRNPAQVDLARTDDCQGDVRVAGPLRDRELAGEHDKERIPSLTLAEEDRARRQLHGLGDGGKPPELDVVEPRKERDAAERREVHRRVRGRRGADARTGRPSRLRPRSMRSA